MKTYQTTCFCFVLFRLFWFVTEHKIVMGRDKNTSAAFLQSTHALEVWGREGYSTLFQHKFARLFLVWIVCCCCCCCCRCYCCVCVCVCPLLSIPMLYISLLISSNSYLSIHIWRKFLPIWLLTVLIMVSLGRRFFSAYSVPNASSALNTKKISRLSSFCVCSRPEVKFTAS